MTENYAKWLVRHPYQAILLGLLVVAVLAPGLGRIGFDQDYRVFFAKEFPPLAAYNDLQDTYSKNDNLLFALDLPDDETFSANSLGIVRELTERAWQIPYAVRVESVTNYQHTSANGDELRVDDLVRDPKSLDDAELKRLKSIALAEPELRDRLISADGRVTGVNVMIELPGESNDEAGEVMKFARGISAEFEQRYPGLSVHLTGIIPMNYAFPEASMVDMMTLVPVMYGVIVLLIGLLLRSVWGTVATLLMITFSVVAALGASGYLGIHITPPSASTPTMIMTLALADSIHLLTYMFHNMRRGMEREAAIVDAISANFQPMLLTSIAAAIGFLSMNFSESPPFRDLGNITTLGVVAAFIFSVLVLPAVMRIVPMRGKVGHESLYKWVDWIADLVIARRRWLAAGGLVSVLLFGAFIPRIELNDEWLEYFDQAFAFRVDTEFAADQLTGIYTIEYSIPAKGEWGIADPEYLQNLSRFVEWYRARSDVRHVLAIPDTLRRLNRSMHGDDLGWYRLPDSRESAAELLMVYEMSLPYGHDLNSMINVAKSASRVAVSLDTLSAVEIKTLEREAEQWMHANLPTYMFAHGSSPTVMFTHISQRNIRQMLSGTTIALLMVSAVLILALRSIKIGLLSLIPNLVPAVLGFGVWGLLVGEIGLATSIVAAMTIGIVIDDTVHFLSKYRRARAVFGYSPEESVRYAFRTVGVAMLVTSLVLVAGFLVLSQSAFEMNSGMGLLTALTLALALVADFTLLPVLLLAFDRREAQAETEGSGQIQIDSLKFKEETA